MTEQVHASGLLRCNRAQAAAGVLGPRGGHGGGGNPIGCHSRAQTMNWKGCPERQGGGAGELAAEEGGLGACGGSGPACRV